jgi:hypothetical protein
LRACSACAGDYEDPDRTVWTPDEEVEDLFLEKAQEGAQEKAENESGIEGENDDANGDEFPLREAGAAGKEAMRCDGRNKKRPGL